MDSESSRLIVVSNRLPVSADADQSGHWNLRTGTGGLVTALTPVLQARGGKWIGWLGVSLNEEISSALEIRRSSQPYDLAPVDLSQADIDLYYNGFSNEILWPLFHDFIWLCNFDPDYWPAYQSVNQRFAETTALWAEADDFVWVHDYHLLLVGSELRKAGFRGRIGFFLHIPFPSADGFVKIPWRLELLQGLLAYDLLGFQTPRDANNFARCVHALMPRVHIQHADDRTLITLPDRKLVAGAFPISIDYDGFAARARDEDVQAQAKVIREQLGNQQLALGLDRLDYTKGIPRRLRAFAEALAVHPELRRRITFLQIVVPSRVDVGCTRWRGTSR